MSDIEIEKININISILANAATQQAHLVGAVAEQIRALFVVTTALIGVLKDDLDIDLLRERALKAFTDPITDAQASEYVNAMLGSASSTNQMPLEEKIQDHLQKVARTRFEVIEGGK